MNQNSRTHLKNLSHKNRRHIFDRRFIILGVFAFIFAATFAFISMRDQESTSAADLSNFDAGDIMSDEVMSDYNSMSVSEIQTFLKSKNACNKKSSHKSSYTQKYNGTKYTWHVENYTYVCMADEDFNGESAAQIIYNAAQDYKINPKVLIVMLQKESGLITDLYPNSINYRSAMGYGCPDTAACDSKYYGLKNQIRNAASLLHTVLTGGWTNYPIGKNSIYYHPTKSCGSSKVYIKNLATSALYRYTPYQPNSAALKAGYGTGDDCSSYGNRNFYAYYTDWFGDTHTVSIATKINQKYLSLGGSSKLGTAVTGLKTNSSTGIYWIQYKKGYIVGKDETGYYESKGKIRKVWAAQNFESGSLGFPLSDEQKNTATGAIYQEYQGGYVVGSSKTGYYISKGSIRKTWAALGFESSKLGFPLSNEQRNKTTGAVYQKYQNGYIIGSSKTGYYESRGSIRKVWVAQGYESGDLGFPLSNEQKNTATGAIYQEFQNGYIVGTGKTGYYISTGKIREYWAAQGFEFGDLGFPLSNITLKSGTKYVYQQQYQGGTVYYDSYHNKVYEK